MTNPPQPPALSDTEIDALQSHFVDRNTHLHPVFDQAKRANALSAEVERLRKAMLDAALTEQRTAAPKGE